MSQIHRWWANKPAEIFWLEVTRRPDVGANLKAPQTNEQGDQFWSYSLVQEVKDSDVVYHYDGTAQAIIARSRATGTAWDGELTWVARGASARSAKMIPHVRPGWYYGLERFERLVNPVTLEALRKKEDAIRALRESLANEFGDPLYFPFEIGGRRPIRPMQGYLFKLPSAFLELMGLDLPDSAKPLAGVSDKLGDEYRPADELAVLGERDPFSVDPALVERSVRGHAITQNGLAFYLRSQAMEPRSPRADEPNFDLAWRIGDFVFVAEVKSLTLKNEEKQLRLGLGQVLRYAHQLGHNVVVKPVLAVERRPNDHTWMQLCERLGVILVWPEVFSERLSKF